MKKFTLLFSMLIAFTMTAFAQNEGEDGAKETPTVWLLESDAQNYTELQYFTVTTDADYLEVSGRGDAQLISVATGASLKLQGYLIGYSMALLEAPTAVKAVGEWKVSIPEGYYTLTKDSVNYPSPAFERTFTIAAPEDFKIVSITPENGSTVSMLDKIMIKFNYPPMDCYETFNVLNAAGDTVSTVNAYVYDEEGNWYDGWLTMRFQLSDTIVEKGTYYLHIPDSTIKKQADQVTPISEVRLVFHVDGSLATTIDGVLENTAIVGAVYDITGRRVDAIKSPGIYIINGRKRLVK